MKETKRTASLINTLIILPVVMSIVSLIMEQRSSGSALSVVIHVIDFIVLALFSLEFIITFLQSKQKKRFFRDNLFGTIFLVVFTLLFIINKYLQFSQDEKLYANIPVALIILRNVFVLLKVFGRIRRLTAFMKSMTTQPARTVLITFFIIIITGTVVLMLPFSTPPGGELTFIDSLFTSTSAVCVTGLIVVDTPTAFTFWGQTALLSLIQVGGLGIMILSFFVVFVMGKSMSLEDKTLISFVLSNDDMRSIKTNLIRIILLTFLIEGIGAAALFLAFGHHSGFTISTVFLSIFHAISAFCNAGFALFSDSLEGFRSDGAVNLIISILIILGGISFFVILNLKDNLVQRLKRAVTGRQLFVPKLTVNTKIILIGTLVLLIGGMLIFYATEHSNTLAAYDLKTQYLSAWFQSVTLRTAGFNTVPMGNLMTGTLLIMILFMFTGAASGSTAGGIKISTCAIILAYIRSILKERRRITIFEHAVPRDLILRAFFIVIFGAGAILAASFFLTFTETADFSDLLFEAVSAFGTVGLSTGVTSSLSNTGKIIIIILMFFGRLGPLTLLAAASRKAEYMHIDYPNADVTIG